MKNDPILTPNEVHEILNGPFKVPDETDKMFDEMLRAEFANDDLKTNTIHFSQANKEVLRIEADGRIFWNQQEVDTYTEFRAAMMELNKTLSASLNKSHMEYQTRINFLETRLQIAREMLTDIASPQKLWCMEYVTETLEQIK